MPPRDERPASAVSHLKYAGVLAPASAWRSRIAPRKDVALEAIAESENANDDDKPRRRGYRPWAELLKRTFAVDVLACPKCMGRMTLLAFVTEPKSIHRLLTALGESTDVPERSPSRGHPYWKSIVLRRLGRGLSSSLAAAADSGMAESFGDGGMARRLHIRRACVGRDSC